ncbi:MAG: T9SS type B sorting domain-containing protein [Bacteroidetes bacterium]|nr:T9SS type B sorting domain-containing protein [Bacteroidota bacterium]
MKHMFDYLMEKKALARKLLAMAVVVLSATALWAEGSKDFVGYGGYRLFLDNRNEQQLKVYANVGETINVGASHVGIAGGYIKVYSPDGVLVATFDGTGGGNTAIIHNNVEELAGPTGGAGYTPGIVNVPTGQDGIWTVRMAFPVYQAASFQNLLNSDPWNRATNQPTTPTVITAWDITVSTGGAANAGGSMLSGRVYSNEYVSVISQNGYMTSPIFYVLTKGGFLYELKFMDTDPYRFSVTSSSRGIVNGNADPTYNSFYRMDVSRSSNPLNWVDGSNYYYEPQAEDYQAGNIVNNKVFFNVPDPTMPATAKVTDIFRNNTHTTWLFNMPSSVEPELSGFGLNPTDTSGQACLPGAMEVGQGAWITFESTQSGVIYLSLDLNNDGDFKDSVDLTLTKPISIGIDSIFWDGSDGLGQVIPVTSNFTLNYKVELRDGETHVFLFDVENNPNGVSLKLISDVKASSFDQFFYNHTNVGGPVSGSNPNGQPGPTNVPFVYQNNFGDNKIFDNWAFVIYNGAAFGNFTVDITDNCLVMAIPDSDGDGIRDNQDIDDDNDGIPDAKEFCNPTGGFACLPGGRDPSADEDGDGIQNYRDANDPAVPNNCVDADNDGVCDKINAEYDIDGDGIPDHLDLDSDNDGITDLVEAGHNQPDANGDGRIDGAPAIFGMNGLYNPIASDPDDLAAVETYSRSEWDGDGVPDHDDLDSDNDGINDVAEAGLGAFDTNNDGRIGGGALSPAVVGTTGLSTLIDPVVTGHPIVLPPDRDNDGVRNWHDLDSDNDGIHDVEEAGKPDPDNDAIIGMGAPVVDTNGKATAGANGQALATTSSPLNTDGDFRPDYLDLDTDNDGINDVAEASNLDPDNNGMVGAGNPVVNSKGVPMVLNSTPTSAPTDTDGDGVRDYRDLDSDNDGINDVAEATQPDPDNDGIIGSGNPTVDLTGRATTDLNGLALSTTSEPLNTDNDVLPDYRDLDTDGDGIWDVTEASIPDPDHDGIVGSGTPAVNAQGQASAPNLTPTSNPTNTDGVDEPDFRDKDSDNDGIVDVDECPFDGPCTDGDNDGIPDFRDIDRDNDGLEDAYECGTSNPCPDTDGDGIPDVDDLDSDDDGLTDMEECPAGTPCPDSNSNGTPNWQEYTCHAGTTVAIITNLSSATTVCEGETVNLSAENNVQLSGTVSYNWTGPNGFSFNGTASPQGPFPVALNNLTVADSGDYKLIVYTEHDCPSQPATANIAVTTTPATPTLNVSDTQPCNGNDVMLTTAAQAGSNVEYQWFFGNSLLTTTSTPSFLLSNVNTTNTGSYSVKVVKGDCESDPSTVVNVQVSDVANFAPGLIVSQDALCEGEILGLSATGIPMNATYTWFYNNGVTAYPIGTSTVPSYTIMSVTPSNTGNYTVVASVGGCTSPPSNAEPVVVGGQLSQAPVLAASADTPCQGEQLQLNATAYPGLDVTYQWMFNDGTGAVTLATTLTPSFELNNVNGSNTGTYLVVAGTTGCPPQSSNMEDVVVNTAASQTPDLIVANAVLCQTQSIELSTASVGSGGKYYWYFNANPIEITNTPSLSIANATTANSGDYSVSVLVGGCTSPPSATETVTVGTVLAQTPVISANAGNLCEGETLQLSSTDISGATYEWFYNGGNGPVSLGTSLTPSFSIANTSVANSGLYTVQASLSGCVSQPSNSQNVVVFDQMGSAPTLSVSANVLCEGESLTLSTTVLPGSNVQYEWFFSPTGSGSGSQVSLGTTTAPNLQLNNLSGNSSGIYTVVAGNGNCITPASNGQSVSVTNNIGPALSLTVVDDVLCEGETLELNSSIFPSNNVSYNWYFDNGTTTTLLGTTNLPTFFVQNMTVSNIGIYTVTASVGNCATQPSNAQDVNVTNSLSGVPTLTVSAPQICEGETLTLNSSVYPGTNILYQWYFDNGTTTSLLATTNLPTFFVPNLTASNEGAYTVVVASGNCTTQPSNAQSVDVTNALNGTPTLAVSSTQLCEGQTLTLNSSTFAGSNASYLWYFDGGTGPVLLATTNVPTYFVNNATSANAGEYTVVVASGNCSTQPSNVAQVTVSNLTGTALQLGVSDEALCEGQTLTLNSSSAPFTNMQYQWFLDFGTGPMLLATTNVPTFFINNMSNAYVGTYSVVANNGNCSTPLSNLEVVSLVQAPTLLTESSTDASSPACRGDLVQLNVTSVAGAIYEWTGPQGFTANSANPVLPSATTGQAGEYTATVTIDGCSFQAPVAAVHVFTGIAAADDIFDVSFNETLTQGVLVFNDQTGNVQNWDIHIVEKPTNGTAKIVNGQLEYTPRENFFGQDALVYEICNTDCPDDCDRATVRFNVLGTNANQPCFAPNIITPNGDGRNDHFTVPCLETTYTNNNVRIFNRWGDKVFEQDGYKNDWDSSYKGSLLPPGTYFYLIQLDKSSSEVMQGYFTITR